MDSTSSVHYLKVVHLKIDWPPSKAPVRISDVDQPTQRTVVGDNCKSRAVQINTEFFNANHYSEAFLFSYTIMDFRPLKYTWRISYYMFPSAVVQLSKNCSYRIVGSVGEKNKILFEVGLAQNGFAY